MPRLASEETFSVHARTIYGCLERARNAYLVILFRCYSNPIKATPPRRPPLKGAYGPRALAGREGREDGAPATLARSQPARARHHNQLAHQGTGRSLA